MGKTRKQTKAELESTCNSYSIEKEKTTYLFSVEKLEERT